jgi:biopolymer transport protein ExbD
MFVLNFSDAETDERIRLPLSQLAKPPEVAPEQPITLQVSRTGTVYITGDEVPVAKIKPYLQREVQLLDRQNKDKANTTIIIRGDAEVETGKVQDLIRQCQDVGFERFSLRAKQPDR